ncbi:MAG: sulfatase [Myxococcota bacterium]
MTRRKSISLSLVLLAGCSSKSAVEQQPPPVEKATPKPASLIRLAEHLDEAQIESPLLAVEPIDLRNADAVASKTIFAQSFERFSARKARWKKSAGCGVERAPDKTPGDKAMFYSGVRPYQCIFLLPVEPATHYRIARSIFTRDPNVDFQVIELRVKLARPNELNNAHDVSRATTAKFVSIKNLVTVHRFAPAKARGVWERGVMHVLTSTSTGSILLMVSDAEATVAHAKKRVWFDDVRADKLEPTPSQVHALLKGQLLAEGGDPRRGLYKHGQFLPTVSLADAKPPYDDNFSYRYGLLAVAPTTIRFTVDVPNDARLRFSTGMFKMSAPGDSATFRVRVEAAGAEKLLHDETLNVAKNRQGWHWNDARISLAEWAGTKITLTFETSAPGNSRGLAVWANPIIDAPRTKDEPPNVIFIAVDTLRADRLSAYGYERPTSPNLEALAADGVRFDNAISASNWTSSSFGSLFTGVMPSRHRVIHRARAIPREMTTLAEHFRRAGYATHGVVFKAYLYDMGFEQGFDTFFNVPSPDVRADDNLGKAMAWLDDQGDRRFFFFLHLNDPHQPFNQPPPFDRKFNDASELKRFGVKLPIIIEPTGGVRGCRKCRVDGKLAPGFQTLAHDLYDGTVAYVDDRIGKLFAALEARGLYEDTIIVLVSDHGEMMWEHNGYFGHGGANMQQELIRVPLIIKPARSAGFQPGRTVATVVRTPDLMPTLLELAGLPPIETPIDAESLVGLMRDGRGADRLAYSENVKQNILAVRDGTWKYVLHNPPGRKRTELLFDLSSDPGEKKNRAGKQAEILAEMRHHADVFFDDFRNAAVASTASGVRQSIDGERLEALKALGYVR